jgi:hypothetical protein
MFSDLYNRLICNKIVIFSHFWTSCIHEKRIRKIWEIPFHGHELNIVQKLSFVILVYLRWVPRRPISVTLTSTEPADRSILNFHLRRGPNGANEFISHVFTCCKRYSHRIARQLDATFPRSSYSPVTKVNVLFLRPLVLMNHHYCFLFLFTTNCCG